MDKRVNSTYLPVDKAHSYFPKRLQEKPMLSPLRLLAEKESLFSLEIKRFLDGCVEFRFVPLGPVPPAAEGRADLLVGRCGSQERGELACYLESVAGVSVEPHLSKTLDGRELGLWYAEKEGGGHWLHLCLDIDEDNLVNFPLSFEQCHRLGRYLNDNDGSVDGVDRPVFGL